MSYSDGAAEGESLGLSFVTNQTKKVSRQKESLRVYRGVVTDVASGLVSYQRDTEDDDEDAGYPLVFPGIPGIGDTIVAVMLGGAPVVLGILGSSLPSKLNLGSPLIGQVYPDGASASASANATNTTTGHLDALSYATTQIPDGTYDMVVDWSLALSDTVAASVTTRCVIGASNGAEKTLQTPTVSPATNMIRYVDRFSGIVVAGGITAKVQYRRATGAAAGTASARNPAIFITAVKTA